MRLLVTVATAIVIAAAVSATGLADSGATIGNFFQWNGSDSIGSFGTPDTATYGQTLVVPPSDYLNSFTFEVHLPPSLIFRGEVYGWNGTEATTHYWESSPMSTTTGHYQPVTFTPNVKISPGTAIVIFASVSKDYARNPANTTGFWAGTVADTYAGGTEVHINDTGHTGQWTTTAWSSCCVADLLFSAQFSDHVVSSPRGGYCSVAGNTNPDGTPIPPGTFLNLDVGQATSDVNYKGAVPAAYFEGIGISCDNPPPGYTDTGTKVNSGGVVSADGLYEYWVKS